MSGRDFLAIQSKDPISCLYGYHTSSVSDLKLTLSYFEPAGKGTSRGLQFSILYCNAKSVIILSCEIVIDSGVRVTFMLRIKERSPRSLTSNCLDKYVKNFP